MSTDSYANKRTPPWEVLQSFAEYQGDFYEFGSSTLFPLLNRIQMAFEQIIAIDPELDIPLRPAYDALLDASDYISAFWIYEDESLSHDYVDQTQGGMALDGMQEQLFLTQYLLIEVDNSMGIWSK